MRELYATDPTALQAKPTLWGKFHTRSRGEARCACWLSELFGEDGVHYEVPLRGSSGPPSFVDFYIPEARCGIEFKPTEDLALRRDSIDRSIKWVANHPHQWPLLVTTEDCAQYSADQPRDEVLTGEEFILFVSADLLKRQKTSIKDLTQIAVYHQASGEVLGDVMFENAPGWHVWNIRDKQVIQGRASLRWVEEVNGWRVCVNKWFDFEPVTGEWWNGDPGKWGEIVPGYDGNRDYTLEQFEDAAQAVEWHRQAGGFIDADAGPAFPSADDRRIHSLLPTAKPSAVDEVVSTLRQYDVRLIKVGEHVRLKWGRELELSKRYSLQKLVLHFEQQLIKRWDFAA